MRRYWRRYWTCKWKMSFSRRRKTENNMQACFNILVLHRKIWCYISEKANLCCSVLLIPKTRRILTEIEDFISESIWPFFDKKSKMCLGNIFEQVFINDSNLFILILTTLFRFKRNSTFLLGNVENLEDRSVRLEYSSKLLRFKRCCWKETKKFL